MNFQNVFVWLLSSYFPKQTAAIFYSQPAVTNDLLEQDTKLISSLTLLLVRVMNPHGSTERLTFYQSSAF